MHYHNVFLVKAEDSGIAIAMVKLFLEPYYEGVEVEPYKEYLSEQDIQQIAEYYKCRPDDVDSILEAMPKWDGDEGGVDKKGIFYWRTYNPRGEWDWYQFGGRWMWCPLVEKYMDNIAKPGTDHYWNRFHDPEVKGKKWLCEFPDGTVDWLDYGSEYPLQKWTNNNPTWFEVIDATDSKFFEHIEISLKAKVDADEWDEQQIAKYETGKEEDRTDMLEWYRRKLKTRQKRWTISSYFWNITDDCQGLDKERIGANPTHWFLVNVDLHS